MKRLLLILMTGGLGYVGASAQVLADSDLELSGAGGTIWTSTSTNFGTVLCDGASCGTCTGPCVPNSGSWFAWFGGAGGAAETGTIAQSFTTATAGGGPLTFFWKVPMKGADGDTLTIDIDGTVIHKAGTTDSIGAYTQVSAYVNSLAAGAHTITFTHVNGSGVNCNTLVDDIQLSIYNNAGTEEIDFTNGVKIYSNYDAESVMIAYNLMTTENLKLTVTDMTGKTMYNQRYMNQQASQQVLSVSEWASGIYNITLTTDKGYTVTKKVFVN